MTEPWTGETSPRVSPHQHSSVGGGESSLPLAAIGPPGGTLTGNNESTSKRELYAQTGHIRACITGHPYSQTETQTEILLYYYYYYYYYYTFPVVIFS